MTDKRTCAEDGCEVVPRFGNEWCSKHMPKDIAMARMECHYGRWRRRRD